MLSDHSHLVSYTGAEPMGLWWEGFFSPHDRQGAEDDKGSRDYVIPSYSRHTFSDAVSPARVRLPIEYHQLSIQHMSLGDSPYSHHKSHLSYFLVFSGWGLTQCFKHDITPGNQMTNISQSLPFTFTVYLGLSPQPVFSLPHSALPLSPSALFIYQRDYL